MLAIPEGDHPLTAAEVAPLFGELAWLCRALFEEIGRPASEPPAPKVAHAALSRRFGEVALQVEALIPESVLLEPVAKVAGGPGTIRARDQVAAADGAHRAAAVAAVVAALRADAERLLQRLSPVSDEPARRMLRHLIVDLDAAAATADE